MMQVQTDRNSDSDFKKLYTVGGILLGSLFFVVIILLSVWQTFTHRPKFHKPIFLINSVLVEPFNISDSHLTANWNISITVKTEHTIPMIFEDVKASVLLKGVVVSSTEIESFSLKYMTRSSYWRCSWEENEFRANLVSSSVPINETVAEAVNYKRTKDGALVVSLNITSVATMNPGDRKNLVNKKHVIALCEDLKLVFATDSITSPAVLIGQPFECNNVLVHD